MATLDDASPLIARIRQSPSPAIVLYCTSAFRFGCTESTSALPIARHKSPAVFAPPELLPDMLYLPWKYEQLPTITESCTVGEPASLIWLPALPSACDCLTMIVAVVLA